MPTHRIADARRIGQPFRGAIFDLGTVVKPEVAIEHAPPRMAYSPELDGLRAVASIAVVLFHLPVALIPSGTQGVDVFSVITGYLMGRAVLAKRAELDLPTIRRFVLNRVRRLFPLLFAVTTAYAVCLVAAGYRIDPMIEVVPVLLYVSNLTTIWGHPPQWFLHTWTLSLEFQFYLALPLFGLATRRLRAGSLLIFLMIVYGSLSLSRLYYFGLPGVSVIHSLHPVWQISGMILGMSVAIMPPCKGSPWTRPLGPAALALILFGFTHPNETLVQNSLWMSLTEMATAALIWTIVGRPVAVIRIALGSRVISTIGTWSYGIYFGTFRS